jgi:hypothetical protein
MAQHGETQVSFVPFYAVVAGWYRKEQATVLVQELW